MVQLLANTVNQDHIVDGEIPLAQGQYGGERKVIQDEYTAIGATLDDTSIITGVELPDGAIVLGIKLKFSAFGTGVLFDVGDTEDPNRYYNQLDVALAGVKDDILQASIGHKVGAVDEVTQVKQDDKQILITVDGADADADAKVTVIIDYV